MKIAILGANGFVGHHLFTTWQTRGPHTPRAVVRSPAGLARIARFGGAEWKLAEARDESALLQAFTGCDAVVHCVVGDPQIITATIDPVYRAASRAGVGKLIYLSSASVHGQNPPTGTTEESPLSDRQDQAYNNAKVRAERRLRAVAADRAVETIILRPGIVFGARSRWVTDVADALLAGSASWIDGGRGLCNSLYVDNLRHAIELALAAPGLHGETFLLGDAETVAWRDLYLGIARAFDRDETAFAEALPSFARRTWRDTLGGFKATPFSQAMLPLFPGRLKNAVKGALTRWHEAQPPSPWTLPTAPGRPVASPEMTQLFACRTQLPHVRATRLLGYVPVVSFPEGLRQSIAWLERAGYPVHPSAKPFGP